MKDQGKLKHGTKDIKINDYTCKYTGLLDANGNEFGEGEAVRDDGAKHKGIFKEGRPPLFCK